MSSGLPVPPRRYRLASMVVVLLLAAAIRFIGLDNTTPPGLEHDEVAHWLINLDILAGNHAIYFTEAYGHEALFHYAQAYFGALVGDNALALRLPAAYCGLLVVAVGFALGRRLFGWSYGFWSAAFLAVVLWPVFYSRLALRAIMLPVLAGLAAVAWWVAADERQGRKGAGEQGSEEALSLGVFAVSPAPMRPRFPASSVTAFAIAGALAGLSFHTYMAARAVPIFFGLYTGYLLLFHRAEFRRLWRGIVAFWLVYALVALPLVIYLLNNPGAEVRIGEVDAPLRALLAGDPRPVLENGLKLLGMFGVRGDPLWRQNVAFLPTFDPLLGLLFYGGLLLALWRWRQPRYAFVVLWVAVSTIPSLVTVDAPSSIRAIMMLPVLMLVPLLFIHKMAELSTDRYKFSTKTTFLCVTGLLVGLWLLTAGRTINGLWRVWPAADEVRFVWQKALTDAARHLDASPESSPVAVGGWTPETMDPPTMALTLRREDLILRYFNPAESLIIPGWASGDPSRAVRPSILPYAPLIGAVVGADDQVMGEFALAEFAAASQISAQHPAAVDFGDSLRFLGYDAAAACADVAAACEILTYWQVLAPADGDRRFFLHVVDDASSLIAQDDRLGAPAAHWQPGDLVLQQLTLPTTAGELRLGVYDPASGTRLLTTTGADTITLER